MASPPVPSVLVIRPRRNPDSFVEALQARGCRVYSLPVMAIEPLPASPAIKGRILDFDHYHKAVVISANAARLALDWLDQYWPQLPLGVDFFAVGRSTAGVLEKAGIESRFPAHDPTSEGLLGLRELDDLTGERVLIFRGRGGRDKLARELRRRGARVDYCELYQRRPLDEHGTRIRGLIADGAIDVLAVHSGEVLRAFLALVPTGPWQGRLTLLVPGERVAELARELGFTRVIVAGGALPEDMVEALWRCYTVSD